MITALAFKKVAQEIGGHCYSAEAVAQAGLDSSSALFESQMSESGGSGDFVFKRVSTDTRTLRRGDLFVALRGDNFDAHNFLPTAVDRGASGLVVECRGENIALPQMVVKDTTLALGKMAAINRRHFSGPLVAITGSCGKTTVKEMVASIFSACCNARVHATYGNLNNHIGVPLTLLNLDAGHEYAVIEMGANAPGEIAYLSGLASPTVALVNNIMPAHVEGFGSIEGVASAKAEIFSGLACGGKAVINLDDRFAEQLRTRSTEFDCLTFSSATDVNAATAENLGCRPDFYATDIRENNMGNIAFVMHSPLGKTDISLQVIGQQNVANALAAAACCYAAGVRLENIQQGLQHFSAIAGRMNIRQGLSGSVVIDDSYNANPGSVRVAADTLSAWDGEKVLVLGDMAELGPEAPLLHREVGDYAKSRGIDRLITVGVLSEEAGVGFGAGAEHFPQHTSAIDRLHQIIDRQMVLLVKGSRSARMELVVRAISEHGEQ
ncbi:MAG: UDP-N-acetylmuramoyl-tripeptide--D-alanyl-D-alanine ligase [Exilibacterium sp.]